MKIDFSRKLIGVFGSHECGKSRFIKTASGSYDTVVFDTLREYDENKFDVYRPRSDQKDALENEANSFIGDIRETKQKDKADWDMVVLSEASSYLRNNGYGQNINNFLNYYRHDLDNQGWEMGGMYDARRPAKVSSDLREVTKYFVIFGGIKGLNDVKALNSIADGLGDRAKQLDTPFDRDCPECSQSPDPELCSNPDHSPFEFLLVYPDRSFERFDPI